MDPSERQRLVSAVIKDASLSEVEKRAKIKDIMAQAKSANDIGGQEKTPSIASSSVASSSASGSSATNGSGGGIKISPAERQKAVAAVIKDVSLSEAEKRARIKDIMSGKTTAAASASAATATTTANGGALAVATAAAATSTIAAKKPPPPPDDDEADEPPPESGERRRSPVGSGKKASRSSSRAAFASARNVVRNRRRGNRRRSYDDRYEDDSVEDPPMDESFATFGGPAFGSGVNGADDGWRVSDGSSSLPFSAKKPPPPSFDGKRGDDDDDTDEQWGWTKPFSPTKRSDAGPPPSSSAGATGRSRFAYPSNSADGAFVGAKAENVRGIDDRIARKQAMAGGAGGVATPRKVGPSASAVSSPGGFGSDENGGGGFVGARVESVKNIDDKIARKQAMAVGGGRSPAASVMGVSSRSGFGSDDGSVSGGGFVGGRVESARSIDERIARKQAMAVGGGQSPAASVMGVSSRSGFGSDDGSVSGGGFVGGRVESVKGLDKKIARKQAQAGGVPSRHITSPMSRARSGSGDDLGGYVGARAESVMNLDDKIARKQAQAGGVPSRHITSPVSRARSGSGDDLGRYVGARAESVMNLDDKIARKQAQAGGTGRKYAASAASTHSSYSSAGDNMEDFDGGSFVGGRAQSIKSVDDRIARKAAGAGMNPSPSARSAFGGSFRDASSFSSPAAAAKPGFEAVTNDSEESSRIRGKQSCAGRGKAGGKAASRAVVGAQAARDIDDRIARKAAGAGGQTTTTPLKGGVGGRAGASAAGVGAHAASASADKARSKEGWVDDSIFDPRTEIRHVRPEEGKMEVEDDGGDYRCYGDGGGKMPPRRSYHGDNGCENEYWGNLGEDADVSQKATRQHGLSREEMAQKVRLSNAAAAHSDGDEVGSGKHASMHGSQLGAIAQNESARPDTEEQSSSWFGRSFRPGSLRGGSWRDRAAASSRHTRGHVLDAEVDMTNPDLLGNKSFWANLDKNQICVGATICLLVLCAVVIPVVYIKNQPDPPERASPTAAPTGTFESDFAVSIFDRLAQVSGANSLQTHMTPQNRAFAWLLFDDKRRLTAESPNLVQRYILMVLFFTSGGGSGGWIESGSDWGSDKHECEWDRVKCEGTGCPPSGNVSDENRATLRTLRSNGRELECEGEVVYLDLKQNVLKGTLATEIGQLTSLKYLNIAKNSLNGPIPSHLYGLENLEYLLMEDNQLESVIDDRIGNLVKLRTLSAHDNFLSGTLPKSFRNLVNLKILYLHSNDFTGPIMDYIVQMKELEEADNANNGFNGTIPSSIGELTKLELLIMSNNVLSGTIPTEIGEMVALKQFINHFNRFVGTLPTEIGNLADMEWFKLDACMLFSTIPTEFGLLENLELLDLSKNMLNGTIPTQFGELEHIQSLQLYNNQLGGTLPTELGRMKQLKQLLLENNNFGGTVSDEVCALRTEPNLLEDLRVDCKRDVKCPENCCTSCS